MNRNASQQTISSVDEDSHQIDNPNKMKPIRIVEQLKARAQAGPPKAPARFKNVKLGNASNNNYSMAPKRNQSRMQGNNQQQLGIVKTPNNPKVAY